MSRFYTTLVEIYTEEVLQGFLPCGFPEENICVLCVVLVFLFRDSIIMNCFRISSKHLKKSKKKRDRQIRPKRAHLLEEAESSLNNFHF